MVWWMPWLSGFACLIYQILWMRQAGLLFGNTSQAAALTLGLFFGGLAAGGWFWGKRSHGAARPLRDCGWLELGIAASGTAILAAPAVVPAVYPLLHGHGGALASFKFLGTLLLVFPASFCMGGSLPLLGQAVIRSTRGFGTTAARIYAVNTTGAACGAFAAAFLLIGWLGVRLTCLTAMLASTAAALLAFRLARQEVAADGSPGEPAGPPPAAGSRRKKRREEIAPPAKPPFARPLIGILAFVSGFNLLALEVVWTRMLAQIHENSVYGFATVLIVVLACLALGSWLASRLARGGMPAPQVLQWLFALGGAALAVTPFAAMRITHGMEMLETDHAFAAYVLRLFVTGFAVIAPACLPLGAVFPYLMKGEEMFTSRPGESIGRLSAINTTGAILGSLAAGFVLLDTMGWRGAIQLTAAVYLLAAVLLPAAGNRVTLAARAGSAVALLLLFTRLDPSRLPEPPATGPDGERLALLEKWEGSEGTVTVVKDSRGDIGIRINSNYSLGSKSAYGPQIYQARIPLLAWPATGSVFFLGMGTGITAGESLSRDDFPQVERVVACELSPGVVKASRKYFGTGADGFDPTNGLFRDPRARIVTGDGRHHLMADPATYAMINADLFLPYRRGTGNLYSREHFEVVRRRLEPGGVFVQWLPLYQISEREFGIIARTMIAAFPRVTLWRGNFQPGAEIAALVGHADLAPLPACPPDGSGELRRAVDGAGHLDMQDLMLPVNPRTVPLFYGGDLTRAAGMFEGYPLNTDDRPVIEFGTPRSLHRPADAARPQFLESRFAGLVDRIQRQTPPGEDPFLASRSPGCRRLPLAGSAFHRASIARVHGDEATWRAEWENFLGHWLAGEAAGGN